MRKAPGKQSGMSYCPSLFLTIKDPAAALNHNERFSNVWSVLNASVHTTTGSTGKSTVSTSIKSSLILSSLEAAETVTPIGMLNNFHSCQLKFPLKRYSQKLWRSVAINDTGRTGRRMSLKFLIDSLTGFKIYWVIPTTLP